MQAGITQAWPAISPASLIEQAASRCKGEFAGMRVLRSLIFPSFHRKAVVSVGVDRKAHYLAPVVDGSAATGNGRESPGERADVVHARRLGPQEGVNGAIRKLRRSDHITPVIDAGCIIGRGVLLVPERPKITGRTIFFPEHGVQPGHIPGGRPWVAQVPDEPTAWPKSLMPKLKATVSPLRGGSSWISPFGSHFTASKRKTWKGVPLPQVESRTPFSDQPTTWPRLLIPKALELRPPGKLGSAVNLP